MTYSTDTLPDPDLYEALYDGVATKRFIAWLVDVALVAVATVILVPFTLFTALWYLPLLYATVSFLYRWVTLSRNSATWGMRLAAIEGRQADDRPFDTGTAFLHTAGYFVSCAVFPVQLVSVAMMLLGERHQGLTDHVLGTVFLNRRAA